MSTADIAVIVHGVVDLAGIGAGLAVVLRLAPRRQGARGTTSAKDGTPEAVAAAWPGTAALPPQAAQRQEAYNRLCDDEGKTPAQAAAALGITARTTARDYEARRLAARNGAGS